MDEEEPECAARALDLQCDGFARWSRRFRLLKRAPYCIDSWDFQVDDEYTPAAPLSPTMVLVPGKTRFGIFFGDNTGYYEACNQLAEMAEWAGHTEQAALYRRGEKEYWNAWWRSRGTAGSSPILSMRIPM